MPELPPMPEPQRTSPLAALARPERSQPGPTPVTLAALPFSDKLILRGGEEVQSRTGTALGFGLPGSLQAGGGEGRAALWLGPDEWFILLPAGQAETAAPALREALAGLHHAVATVSDRFAGVAVEGARSREVLNAGCPLDLHPRAFAAGAVARTLLGKAPVVLHRVGEGDRFELHVAVSLAPYLWFYLENAAREHGFTVAG